MHQSLLYWNHNELPLLITNSQLWYKLVSHGQTALFHFSLGRWKEKWKKAVWLHETRYKPASEHYLVDGGILVGMIPLCKFDSQWLFVRIWTNMWILIWLTSFCCLMKTKKRLCSCLRLEILILIFAALLLFHLCIT